MTQKIDSVVLDALGTDSLTVTALKNKTGLTDTALALELVRVGQKVKLGDDGKTIVAKRRGRPTGRSSKVTERVEAAKDAILELRGAGATVQDVVARLGAENVESRDVKAAAAELAAQGEITSTRRGRKLIFMAPISE